MHFPALVGYTVFADYVCDKKMKHFFEYKHRIIFPLVTALLLLIFAIGADAATIRILHVNDFHGFANPYKPLGSKTELGGVANLAARVNELRSEKPSVLLAAGDMIQGNNWANLTKGESVIELMNMMKFDAVVVGNHEFDFGQDILKQRISEMAFPVLGANVKNFDGLKPYVIKEIGGVRIAIIGVVTEETPASTHPKNVTGLKFSSPENTIKKYMADLKGKADIFVVLSHIGYYEDRRLAKEVGGINVIVGGHSHTKLKKPVIVNDTIIVQAWEHGKALGVLDIDVENGKIVKFDGHLEEIRPERGKEDRPVEKLVEKYNHEIDALLGETAGYSLADLDGENVRKQETNLGDLIADIMRSESGSDAAIINGGSIRTSIKKGVISAKTIYTVLPFDTYIVALKLTGKQIREALEHGVSAVKEKEGRFPQVSGIQFTFSLSAKPGSRVKEVLIDGKPLDLRREYVVTTNDFLLAGGDGYKVFQDAAKSSESSSIVGAPKNEKLVYSDSGRWLRDVVLNYIRKKREIAPPADGRIKEIP